MEDVGSGSQLLEVLWVVCLLCCFCGKLCLFLSLWMVVCCFCGRLCFCFWLLLNCQLLFWQPWLSGCCFLLCFACSAGRCQLNQHCVLFRISFVSIFSGKRINLFVIIILSYWVVMQQYVKINVSRSSTQCAKFCLALHLILSSCVQKISKVIHMFNQTLVLSEHGVALMAKYVPVLTLL